MIKCCIQAIVPFLIYYFVFLILFSTCFVILQMEIDPEVDEVEGLGYFMKTVLQTFRTSIGELGMPVYTKLLQKPSGLARNINIMLIWLTWFL